MFPTGDSETPSLSRLVTGVLAGECALFVGAGLSRDSGAPSGADLAYELAEKFLGDSADGMTLADVAALIDAGEGRRALNEYIVDRLNGLSPSETVLAIPKYSWKAIYTTNFDTLVEQAYAGSAEARQRLVPVYSNRDRMDLQLGDVPLYKLHGCITRANTAEGRLTLTPEDFVLYGKIRNRLVARLVDTLSDLPVLYAGFGRSDPDFVSVLLQVEEAAGELAPPRRGYALQPRFTEHEVRRWEQKRVTLVPHTASEFFATLAEAPPAPAPPSVEVARSGLQSRRDGISESLLGDLRRNFDVVDDEIGGDPDAPLFFSGAAPTWSTVAASIDAKRDVADALLEAALVDPLLDNRGTQLLVVHSEAGTGKTTLLRRTAFDMCHDWNRVVIALKPYGELDVLTVEQLQAAIGERVYVVVDNAAKLGRELADFLASARRLRLKITVLVAARTNEWRDAQSAAALRVTEEFELGRLSSDEINRVLDTLAANNGLGLLAGQSRSDQVRAFESRAQKQLLVALREATEGREFDEIIVDEYNNIPTEQGQRAYLLIAALHRFGMLVRAGLLHRSLGVPFTELETAVFRPTERVIIPHQSAGDLDYHYSTRHPLIAEILVDRVLNNERRRVEYYRDLIAELDIGYASDADAYRQLTRGLNRRLLKGFEDPASRRALMAELLELDPLDAYVHQHAAMMEMDLRDYESAAKHLERAIELLPMDPSIRDTEGLLTLRSAEAEPEPVVAEARFGRAEDIFERAITRRPDEPFGYRNLAETYRAWASRAEREDDPEKAAEYRGLAYQTALRGVAACPDAEMLFLILGQLEEEVGEVERARAAFGAALRRNPSAVGARFMASRLEERVGETGSAVAILEDGLGPSGDDPELHARLAQLLAEVAPDRAMDIRSHFEAALLGAARNYRPRLAYAAYLFGQGEFDRAAEHFARLDEIIVPARERFNWRKFAFPGLGGTHSGRVVRVFTEYAWIEFRQGAASVYWRWRADGVGPPALNSTVEYELRFTMKGPVATNVR